MKKIALSLSALFIAGLAAPESVAQSGGLAFQGVKNGECQSVRIFGEDPNGEFLFITADISKKADNYSASDLVTKSFPAGTITLERVECFTRKNRNLFATPVSGGLLSDPYVDLKSPLAVIDLKPGETVYLGALELHKLGWGAGLISHDLSSKVTLPEGTRTQLLSVSYDVEKSLGNAKLLEQSGEAMSEILNAASDMQAPAPADDGKGQVGLFFKSDGIECKSAEILFGREKKGSIVRGKTVRFKTKQGALSSMAAFESEKIRSGRKHLLDIMCNTSDGQFSLVHRNQYGNPKFDWESKGQFDLQPDSKIFLGTLTLAAKPIGNMSEDMAKNLGYFEVSLETDHELNSAPAEFSGAKLTKLTQIQRVLKDQTRKAKFDSNTASKFQSDLQSFLQMKSERESQGPNF